MEREKPVFYICKICGNVVGLIKDSGGKLLCCGREMEKLEANTEDAATEKHIPVYEYDNGKLTVKIGEVEHPMVPEHHTEWICIMQDGNTQRKILKAGEHSEATFTVDSIQDLEIYSYCNLHGLWKTKIEE